MKLERISSLLVLVVSLVNKRQNLVFPCAVFAAALSVGTSGIATAEQCDFEAIAFSSTRDNPTGNPFLTAEIYLMKMNEDGTADTTVNPVRVTNNTDGDGFPALSPDGKKIVFDSLRNRLPSEPLNTSDLFLMNTDGTEQTHLIRGSSASWSPDGKNIAFHRSASDNTCPVTVPPPYPGIPGCPIRTDPGAATWDSDIFIMNVDDGLATNITNSTDYIDDDADWSPDGKKIMFTRHSVKDNQMNSITAEICVLDLEMPNAAPQCFLGTNTNNLEEERGPAWSPDGAKIAYHCRRGGMDFEICVMNADGTGDLQLTDNTVGDLTLSWSPDGQKILFHRLVGVAELWVMNANGTDQTQLTDTPGRNQGAKWGRVSANCDKFWPPVE